MTKREKIITLALFLLGLVPIIGAPCFASFIFSVVNRYDYYYQNILVYAIIPSMWIGGIILAAWGIAFMRCVYNKKNKQRE